MKKVAIGMIISCCMLAGVLLNSCNPETNKASANSEEIIERVRTNDYTTRVVYYLFRDKETGQEYIVFISLDGGITVTPRLPKEE